MGPPYPHGPPPPPPPPRVRCAARTSAAPTSSAAPDPRSTSTGPLGCARSPCHRDGEGEPAGRSRLRIAVEGGLDGAGKPLAVARNDDATARETGGRVVMLAGARVDLGGCYG